VVTRTGNPKLDKKSKSLKNFVKNLMSSTSFKYEKCASELMKIKLKPGQEKEICCVFLELCCENEDYTENLGHITQVRFSIHLYRLLFTMYYTYSMSIRTYILINNHYYFYNKLFSVKIIIEI